MEKEGAIPKEDQRLFLIILKIDRWPVFQGKTEMRFSG